MTWAPGLSTPTPHFMACLEAAWSELDAGLCHLQMGSYKDNAFIIIAITEVLHLDGELIGSRGEQQGKLHKGGCMSSGTKD